MNVSMKSWIGGAMVLGCVGVSSVAAPVWAQQPAQQPAWPSDPAARPPAQPKAAAAPKTQPKTAPAKVPAKEEAAVGKTTDSQLRQRVEQLEEQLADMQVTMGTLESLGKSGGPSGGGAVRAGGSAGGGIDQARVDSLETQIRALTDKVEQLSGQLRQANRRSDIDAPAGDRHTMAQGPRAPGTGLPGGAPPAAGFGNVTVIPGADPIGRMLEPAASNDGGATPLPAAAQTASSPKELYETGYGYLLQSDYGAAEAAFDEFLRRYPGDRQAADAQYWYGETLYVQRRYKPAAQAFLKVADKYPASVKVPNSILKLAMTLEQLGQKDCGLFDTLETGHPNATADVKTKARALKTRVGC